MRSTIGISRKIPGPFGFGRSRPRRKITPRSYSRAILTAAKRNSRTRTRTTTSTIRPADRSIRRSSSVGVDTDPTTSRRSSSTCSIGRALRARAPRLRRVARARAPRSPAPARRDGRRPRSRPCRARRPRRAVAPREATRVIAKPSRSASVAGDADRDRHATPVRVARRVEEHQRAENEHDPTRDRERAVCRHERLGDEERRRENHQQQPGERDGQHLQPVEARGSGRSRRPCPGRRGPGFQSSTTIPMSPIESMSVMRFGSTRKSRARCQKLISTSSICAPAGLEDEPLRHRLHPVDLARAGRGASARSPRRGRSASPRARRSSTPR